MKKSLLKIGLPIVLLVIATFIIGPSCNPSNPPTIPPICVTTGTNFQNIYTNVLASNSLYTNVTTMDLVTHEYTFQMLATKTVCKIGYQGNAALFSASIPYTIEIYNNTTSTMVYTGNHIFNAAFTDYVYPTSAPTLVSGSSYTIRRIASNYLGNIGNTIGRALAYNSGGLPLAAPMTGSFMKITSSNFYGTGGPVPNFGIPYIDIVLI